MTQQKIEQEEPLDVRVANFNTRMLVLTYKKPTYPVITCTSTQEKPKRAINVDMKINRLPHAGDKET